MILERIERTYRPYQTVTREQAYARGFDLVWLDRSRNADIARQLLEQYPNAVAVDFCLPIHNTRQARYGPPQGIIVHLKRYQRRAEIRIGEKPTEH